MPNKAVAGAVGGAGGTTLGSALAILIMAFWWPHADAVSAVALTTVCNAVVGAVSAFIAVYLVPHDKAA